MAKNRAKRVDADAKRRERRKSALALKRSGATYQQIADQLGFHDRAHAQKDVLKALREIGRDEAKDVLALELERLDAILRGGLFERARKGDLPSVDRVMKLMDRRASYLGLNRPQEHAVTFPGINLDVRTLTDAQIERLASGDYGALAEAAAGPSHPGEAPPRGASNQGGGSLPPH
jgi:hypothetical protein